MSGDINPLQRNLGYSAECERELNVQDIDGLSRSVSKTPADHSLSEFEAKWYYFGLRGIVYSIRPPRLIYRTSKDVFPDAEVQWSSVRIIKLLTVHDHGKLRENNMWDTIRDEAASILDQRQIKWSSIDLVRFCWEDDPGLRHDESITGAATLWIGVLPYSTNTTKAFEASEEILKLLKDHDIDDVEIAFRESLTLPFARTKPILPAPVGLFHPLAEFISPLTTALSLPIVASDSLYTGSGQGTLGFYFKVNEDLYGVTARHVLFPTSGGNETYSDDTSSSRKHVVLMAPDDFESYCSRIRFQLRNLRDSLEKSPPAEQKERDSMEEKIVALDNFRNTLRNDWFTIEQRTIGHVVWSPPICGRLNSGEREGYMRDVCVIKLDKDRFTPNMVGNSIDIGMPLDIGRFLNNIYPRGSHLERPVYPPDFELFKNELYPIRRILPVAEMPSSNVQNNDGHRTRFAIKSGPKPETTVGLLNGFLSRVRHYTLVGSFDSIEMAMFPKEPYHDPFASPRDSGAAIVGSNNEFIAQLTSGTGSADVCEIAYGTPMEWLWNKVIKPQFPDAVLFFDGPVSQVE